MSRNKHRFEMRRKSLWIEQKGKCHYCNCFMLHWNDLRNDPGKINKHGIKIVNGSEKIKRPPLKLATIEHLRDKFDPTRQIQPIGYEQRWVLACWECNNRVGRKSEANQPIQELRKRSNRNCNIS